MNNQEQKPNLLEDFRNFSDYAHLVGASSLEAAQASMQAELEVYRTRAQGSSVLHFA